MLSDFEKNIYNTFLRISRSSQNKPYKLRENFESLDNSSIVYINRISKIFNKFKNIKVADFFIAPHVVYNDNNFYDLKFYASQRALKTYTVYMKQESITSPDAEHILIRVADALKFLNNFCKQNSVCIKDYHNHTTNDTPSFILHLKDRSLSFYVMFELPGALSTFTKYDANMLKFMFGKEIFTELSNYKKKYYSSKVCKELSRLGVAKLIKNSCF